MTITVATHRYRPLTAQMRPQDPALDGSGLTFETLEHGGGYADTMPQAIKVTDGQGRWFIYHPENLDGHGIQCLGYSVSHEDERPMLRPVPK
jgi:hypothetical protein